MKLSQYLDSIPLGEREDELGRIAKAIGVSSASAVRHWLNGTRNVPGPRVLKLEQLTGISRHDIRPDIYGPKPRPGKS